MKFKKINTVFTLLLVLAPLMFCGNSANAIPPQKVNETFDYTVRKVGSLYRSEQFAALEIALNELAHTNDKFISGKPKSSAAYWAFRQLFPGPGTDPLEIERIQRWRKKIPLSSWATFAESRYWYGMAWNARGGGSAGNVGSEAWDMFHKTLRRSESQLLESPAALKDTALWHNLLLAISQDSTEVKSKPDQVLSAAVTKWPQYYDFYEVRLTRLVPKWGGNWQTVDAFIADWAKKQSPLEGRSLYARLYISMQAKTPVPVSEIRSHWVTLKTSFRDLVDRYPDERFKNLFASYACLVGDADQFREAMTALGPEELNPADWLYEAPLTACERGK